MCYKLWSPLLTPFDLFVPSDLTFEHIATDHLARSTFAMLRPLDMDHGSFNAVQSTVLYIVEMRVLSNKVLHSYTFGFSY